MYIICMVQVNIPKQVLDDIDEFVKGRYNNRSHFIVEACKEKITREKE